MAEDKEHEELVRVRRAPKMAPFAVLGMGFGFTTTVILTALFPPDPTIGFGTLAGYFSIFGVSAGLGVGVVVWLLLDRRSKKTEKQVRMRKESH